MKKFVLMVVSGLSTLTLWATYINELKDNNGITWYMSAVDGDEPSWNPEYGDIGRFVENDGSVYVTKIVIPASVKRLMLPSAIEWLSHGSAFSCYPVVKYFTVGATDDHPNIEEVSVNRSAMLKMPCFRNCPSLKKFNFENTTDWNPGKIGWYSLYTVKDGVLFDGDMTDLKKYPEGREGDTYTVPASVVKMHQYTFANTKLKKIIFEGDAPEITRAYSSDSWTMVSNSVVKGSRDLSQVCYRRGSKGWGNTWCGVRAVMQLDAPTLTVRNDYDGVHLTWTSEEDPDILYRVQCASSPDMCDGVVSWARGSYFDRENLLPGMKRYYRAMAFRQDGSAESDWGPVVCGERKLGRLKLILDDSMSTVRGSVYGAPDCETDVGALVDGVLTIPDGVRLVAGCLSHEDKCLVRKLVLPDSLKEITGDAFGLCENLTTIVGGDNLTYVEASAFANTPLVDHEAPDFSVVYLGKCAIGHSGWRSDEDPVETLVFKDGTTSVDGFDWLPVKSVVFPLSLQNIGDFSMCFGLEKAVFLGFVDESDVGYYLPDGCAVECRGGFRLEIDDGEVLGWSIDETGDLDFEQGLLTVPDGAKKIVSAYVALNVPVCLPVPNIAELTCAIRIPKSVEAIGQGAFGSYVGLEDVLLENPDVVVDARSFEFSACRTVRFGERTGWILSGWTTPDGQLFASLAEAHAWAEMSLRDDEDFPLQARWQKAVASYEMDFRPGGAVGSMSAKVCELGKVYALPAHNFTAPSGWRFVGWACSNGRRYDDGMMIFNLAEPGETVTMTAIWE